MAQNLAVQSLGLNTNQSPFVVEQGSLLEAKNVVIDRPGLIEQRRGFKRYGAVFSDSFDKVFNYRDRLLVHYDGSTLSIDSDGAGTWSDITGSYAPPATKMRGVEGNNSFFFTTTGGIYKLDALAGTPYPAGVPQGVGIISSADDGTGWLTGANSVNYRIVWGRTDANSITTLGAPSGIWKHTAGGGGPHNIDLVFPVPDGIDTNYFWQLYRTTQVASGDPGDTMQLAAQAYYVSGTTISYTDITPDALLGEYLYTNQNQTTNGILDSNYAPPLACDVATFKGYYFYANTNREHKLIVSLIGTGSPDGIQTGDVLTFTSGVNNFTLTGHTAEDIANKKFKVFTGGTISENIENTARSIVNVLNQVGTNTFLYAQYISSSIDAPGKILFYARDYTVAAFHVNLSAHNSTFIPTIPSAGTTVISDNEDVQNRLYISKLGQPDSVPLISYYDVGNSNYAIRRIVALRDSLFIFKPDGVFRLIGDSPDAFRIMLFDGTSDLRGDDTPATFNNTIFCVTNQGITVVSDGGVMVIGQRIENQILPLFQGNYAAWDYSFGIGYEAARKYILFVPTSTSDTYPTRAFVYHQVSNQFTQWDISAWGGIVNSDDGKLYLLYASEDYVRQERKALDNTDYADNEISVTISSSSTTTTVDLASATGVTAGMVLVQGNNRRTITNVATNTLTLEDDGVSWTASAAIVAEPIATRVLYAPITYGDPTIMKQAYSMIGLFNASDFRDLYMGFRTDLSDFDESVLMVPLVGTGWGDSPWGDEPWGGVYGGAQAIRTFVNREKQWHHWIQPFFENTDAFAEFSIMGFSLQYEPISEVLKT